MSASGSEDISAEFLYRRNLKDLTFDDMKLGAERKSDIS